MSDGRLVGREDLRDAAQRIVCLRPLAGRREIIQGQGYISDLTA